MGISDPVLPTRTCVPLRTLLCLLPGLQEVTQLWLKKNAKEAGKEAKSFLIHDTHISISLPDLVLYSCITNYPKT